MLYNFTGTLISMSLLMFSSFPRDWAVVVLGWFWLCSLVDLRAVLRNQLSDFFLGPCEADKCPVSLCQLNCPSDVAVRGSVHKTRSGLNHVLPRDLFSYFPVRTEESVSIMRYPCQCCSTTRSLQTWMMKGRVKHQPLVTSRALHFDVFLEEIKREVVWTPGIYLLSTHVSSWAWGEGEV